MPWHYVFYTNMLVLIGAAMTALALNLLWKRRAPEALPLALIMLATATWSIMYMLELVSPDLETKLLWAKLKYLGIVMLPTSGLLFTLRYTGREQWLRPRNVILLLVGTLAMFLVVWTNDAHELFWSYEELERAVAFSNLQMSPGIAFWAFAAYSRLIILFCVILIVALFIRSKHVRRRQAGMVIISVLAPFAANAVYMIGLSPFPGLDLVPFGLMITCFLCTWAIFRLRLADIIPIAHATIVEGMGDLIFVLDAENCIVQMNSAACTLIGKPASEVIGHPAQKVLSDAANHLDFLGEETLTGKEVTVGWGNSEHVYDARIAPLADEHGFPLGKVVVMRDVTERKSLDEELQKHRKDLEEKVQQRTVDLRTANQQLRAEIRERRRAEEDHRLSEERYQQILNSSHDMISVIDEDTHVLYANDSWLRNTGYTLQEYNGIGAVKLMHPDDVDRVLDAFRGLTAGFSVRDFEYRRINRKGETVWVASNSDPIQWAGASKAFVHIQRDITKRKQAEEALRESEQKFRSLVEVTSDWVWEVDRNGTYTYASPKIEELLGYKPEHVIGKRPFDFMSPDEKERMAESFTEIVNSRKPFSRLENTNIHKEGRHVVLETNGVPILDADGNLLGFRGIDRDITERKRLESQLFQSSKLAAVGELAAGVAHEINNPLAVIDIQTGLIRAVLEDEGRNMEPAVHENLEGYLSTVEKQVRRCQTITGDLLAFARIPLAEEEKLNVNELVEKTIQLVMPLAEKKPKIEVISDDRIPLFRGDANRLQQVFVNLLSNAINAIDDGGSVTVVTRLEDSGNFRIDFKDTGQGISPEMTDRIFDPFFTTQPGGKGTGLGLSTSYYIIREMQGQIDFESVSGKGSTFTVTLPATPGKQDSGFEQSNLRSA